MMFIVGGSGRLGRALARQNPQAQALARSVYADWSAPGAQDAVARHFAPYAGSGGTIYVASGLLDPRRPEQEHEAVNVTLPRNIIAGATPLGLKVRTFGTVMEALMNQPNAYVRSKVALARHVAEAAEAGLPVAHIRIHTLYGAGEPDPFMFLGQIAAALRIRAPFKMTEGRQLREYHHVDDDAGAVRVLEQAGLHGIVALNHGAPLTLRALATGIFAECGAPELLQLGALPEPAEENYAGVLARPDALAHFDFRPALPAVAQYLKTLVL